MLDSEVKVNEEQSLNSMPQLTEMPNGDELPPEVVLAILYSMAKRLEKENIAEILTGHSPKGKVVTYIKLIGVEIANTKGFVLAMPTEDKQSAVSIPD